MNKKKELWTNILIIILFIAGIIFLISQVDYSKKTNEIGLDQTEDSMPFAINEGDHILGKKDAKIFIVEYSDTECPYCKMFHETMKRVIIAKQENVAWVYRHYPIKSRSYEESLASECAYEQGGNNGFWQYINTIYQITPSNDGLDPKELYNIAQKLNFNTEQFKTCLENETYANKVSADLASGDFLEVKGTPTSFIVMNGKIVDEIQGAQSFETIIAKIDSLLKD